MLVYEYECIVCGHTVNVEQSMEDVERNVYCQACKEVGVEALMRRKITGGSGFILRGGGWARDGYGGKNK